MLSTQFIKSQQIAMVTHASSVLVTTPDFFWMPTDAELDVIVTKPLPFRGI